MIMILKNASKVKEVKKKKLRMTKARRLIIEELEKLDTHPTAYQIFEIVKKKMPRVSLGTVYRNLEILSREQIISRLQMDDRQMHFDGKTTPHYHIRCTICGKIEDIAPSDFLEGIDDTVKRISNFSSIRHRIEFYGVCSECEKKISHRR